MSSSLPPDRLRRLRLAAQRLLPGHHARDACEAARAVVGVQAQDVRAAGLALRARCPGLEREDVDSPKLVRTWSARGTAHLIDADDRDWLHAALHARNRRVLERMMSQRGALEVARVKLPQMVDALEAGPRDRASLLAEIGFRRSELGTAVNVLVPWAVMEGAILSLPDGRLRAADPPGPVDEDQARATLARRYLAGYGPAKAEDLAAWSGLSLGQSRRALQAAGQLEEAGELLALPGTLDMDDPPIPALILLGAFDTTMLGHRRRELLLNPADDHLLMRGGGMVRGVILVRGKVAGFWRLDGSGNRRTLEPDWLGRPGPRRELLAQARDVARFLDIQLTVD